MRNILTSVMLIFMAASAFVAGFVANDFVEMYRGGTDEQELAVFWEAWDRIDESFLGELPTQKELAYGAIRGSMSLLNDPYTIFIEPVARQQERESLQGTFGGIGAFITRAEDGGDVLLTPIPGNPAEAAGIRTDDVLVAVDGILITPEMTVSDVVDLIKGEKGTVVRLTILHEGDGEPVEIDVTRDDILIPSVTHRVLAEDERIGYIRLSRFSGESTNEMETAIVDLQAQGVEKLVLDLRGNGGGLLTAAVDVADHFLADGPILYQQEKGVGEQVHEATTRTIAPDIPMVVLVDGGTASASEILAGALQDRERATLIGSKTFGKGSVQLVYDLSDGSSVHVTSARWFTPERRQLDQQGLEPDVAVELTQEATDQGIDEILLQAVDLLQEG